MKKILFTTFIAIAAISTQSNVFAMQDKIDSESSEALKKLIKKEEYLLGKTPKEDKEIYELYKGITGKTYGIKSFAGYSEIACENLKKEDLDELSKLISGKKTDRKQLAALIENLKEIREIDPNYLNKELYENSWQK
jgi:hypothetical protein